MRSDEIIEKLETIFRDKGYDFSLISDAKSRDYVRIICPKHGEFKKRLSRALNGSGCPNCSGKKKKTFEEFKAEAIKVHNAKYVYNDSNYINAHTPIKIICPKHGEFLQSPTNHLNGNGCPVCKKERLHQLFSSSTDEFIKKANMVHHFKYDYSNCVYKNNKAKVIIICPKHGEFKQLPLNHLSGKGCPSCNESKLEKEIKELLNENGIEYIYQWHLPWSKYYSLDFYLPQHNIGIECQGIQHFEERFKNQALEDIKHRDGYKLESCKNNGIRILYYSKFREKGCITDKEELIKKIFK